MITVFPEAIHLITGFLGSLEPALEIIGRVLTQPPLCRELCHCPPLLLLLPVKFRKSSFLHLNFSLHILEVSTLPSNLFLKIYLLYVDTHFDCMYVYVTFVCLMSETLGEVQELQMVVSYHVCAGNEPRSSGRTASALCH